MPGDATKVSILDHIWTDITVSVRSFVVVPPLSDHFSCVALFDIKMPITLNKIDFKDRSPNKQQHFFERIEDEYFNYHLPNANVDTCVKHFDVWFRNIADKYFPPKTKFISTKRLNNPWLTTRLIKCIRNKHWLYQKYKQNLITYEMYQTYCKLLKFTLKLAEQDCYLSRFRDAKGNSRVGAF